eukprot:68871_1
MSVSSWYYLLDDNESNKQGPVSLEYLIENVPSDCLISNDEMLKSDTPWMLLSELNDSHQASNSLIVTNHNQKHKPIQIKIPIANTNTMDEEPQPVTKKVVDAAQEQQDAKQKAKQIVMENQLKELEQQQHKEKIKTQVLNLNTEGTFEFEDEWFIVSSENQTLGPFTQWQLVTKYNANQINADTITFLNGSKQFRYLKCCGELFGVLPCIERDATMERSQQTAALTKDELENKQYLYKDAYQRECGPISLSELFYKLEHGILGRNSQIKQENEMCWKTVEFIQKQFSKEWKQWNKEQMGHSDKMEHAHEEIDMDMDGEEAIKYKLDPSFRALVDLDKQVQIEKKSDIQKVDQTNAKSKRRKKRKRGNKKEDNKSIYVTGLPMDISAYELEDFFKKAGVIATDIYEKGKKMICVYKKGNALITYHQAVSVKLAMDLLDETEIRNGYPVHVEVSHRRKKRKKKRKENGQNEETLKKLYGVESQLTWNDDIEATLPKLNWIVLQNVWTVTQRNEWSCPSPSFFEALEKEVLEEMNKIGPIDKYELYEDNPKGIIRIKYKFSPHAAQCIKQMNRRYFDGNIIDCFYWDGTTEYSVRETAQEQRQRFENFQKYMDT